MSTNTQNIDAFATALSGLTAQQSKLEMIGNNIANMNTIGYKASRMTFAEQLGQTVGLSYTPFSQGTFQSTGNVTDLAINGDSFFVVKGDEGNLFTRAGNFRFNGEGKLVNPDGFAVRGWMNNLGDEVSGTSLMSDIVIDPNMVSNAQATSNAFLSGNLNSSLTTETEVWTAQETFTVEDNGAVDLTTELNSLSQVSTALINGDTINISGTDASGNVVSASFTYGTDGTTLGDLVNSINSAYSGSATADIVNGQIVLTDNVGGNSDTTILLEAGGSNTGQISLSSFSNTTKGFTAIVSTTMVVYDAQGGAHELTVEFEKTDTLGEWKVSILSNGDETVVGGGSGTITFDSNGDFLGFSHDDGATALTLDPGNGTPAINLTLDLDGDEGFSGLTQFDSVSSLSMRHQDGRETGTLSGFSIDEAGNIIGDFSNGETMELAQIAVAKFIDPSGLQAVSGSLFTASLESGDAQIGKVDEFGGQIQSGTLEMSNVDLANQFTKMIEAQRAFQAASRVVTTLDEVLSETARLKR